jgi:hypothetical protein
VRPRAKAGLIAAVAVVIAVLWTGLSGSFAWTVAGDPNPDNAVTADVLPQASGVNAVKSAGAATNCTSITVSWSAAGAPVNSYVVERRTANGSWTIVSADTGNVTSLVDTVTITQQEVTYRISSRYRDGSSPTDWTAAGVEDSTPLVCGTVGEVDDLQATTTCTATLTWSAAPGATTYDRRYSTNGGGTWTTVTNQAGTSWAFTTAIAAGTSVQFQVRPGIGTGNDGQWSNLVQVDDWGCRATGLTVVHDCDAVLTWDATPSATTYDWRYSTNGGGTWTTTSNITGTTATLTTSLTPGATVLFQVRPGVGTTIDGHWTASEQVDDWGCEVDTVNLVPGCANATLTWTTSSNATSYDTQYSTNGGGTWTNGLTNSAALSWNNTATLTQGATVLHRVRPGIGTASDGKWSDPLQVDDWGFHVVSVQFVNTGTANSLNAGDRVVVTFNRASNGTTPSGTNATSIHIRTGTGTRGVYLSANGTNSAIGRVPFTANISGANTTYTGTAAWSAGNTVWTWTRAAGAAAAHSAPAFTTTFTAGTSAANPARVKCSNGTTNLSTSTFSVSGWF